MRREYYQYYKSIGICVQCGKERSEPNKVCCWECSEKQLSQVRSQDMERKRLYNKRKRDLADAFGVCTTCLKHNKYKGKQCIHCYLKRNRKYRESILDSDKIPKEMWDELNLCMKCGKKRSGSSKLCEVHLEQARNQAAYMRTKVDYKNHKWKQDKHADIVRLQNYKPLEYKKTSN